MRSPRLWFASARVAARLAALVLALTACALVHAAVDPPTAPPPGPPTPPTPPVSAPFTFAVFGDNRPEKADKRLPWVFKQILIEIRNLHPAFVVTTGDLIFGSKTDTALVEKQYDEALPLVQALGVPVYFATGNHEINGSAANEAIYRKRVCDKLYYSFDYGNSHFVILDGDIVGQEHRITGEQFDWLEKDLQQAQAAKHLFVFQHQQPYPVSKHIGTSLDAFPDERDRFQKLLEKYHVEALITGHEHLFDDSVHGGVRHIIAGGAGAPLYPSARGGSFYHYLLVTVDGDKTFITVVKPGSIFAADEVLAVAPSEKKDPGPPLPFH